MAQLVKNLPAMWQTWVQSLGWEDPLEKGEATHSSILAWRIPWSLHGIAESDTTELLSLHRGCNTDRSPQTVSCHRQKLTLAVRTLNIRTQAHLS